MPSFNSIFMSLKHNKTRKKYPHWEKDQPLLSVGLGLVGYIKDMAVYENAF